MKLCRVVISCAHGLLWIYHHNSSVMVSRQGVTLAQDIVEGAGNAVVGVMVRSKDAVLRA